MSVSSISSSSAVASLQKMNQPEALEPSRIGPDHDGDADDRASTATAAKPVMNSSGQVTGLVVNTKA
ncbi:MAG: hypothetical protein COZ24_00785 [Hydrogenophilales bacterium CG_4_10_14_3_um_filter_63_21]|nr:MAG: hypothetical protein COZ24_00785 [Hydrogenophilales bacterium CG_4_10_14_3_um_filter_63_21]